MNARPVSPGMLVSNDVNAPSPPAEAPIPTISPAPTVGLSFSPDAAARDLDSLPFFEPLSPVLSPQIILRPRRSGRLAIATR